MFYKLLSYFLIRRMSLAINAAPFNEDNNDYVYNKKRLNHNKTQKIYNTDPYIDSDKFDNNKVKSVLEEIHNKTEDSNTEMANFNPPPNPESSGVQRTITNEAMQNLTSQNSLNMYKVLGKAPLPSYPDEKLEVNNYRNNYGDSNDVDEYYKKMLPNINGVAQKNPINRPYYNNESQVQGYATTQTSQDILLQKLNYMINLLEEQQDEKTNNVTEEVILYSFLGIFIIFVIDSFARVGKYVR